MDIMLLDNLKKGFDAWLHPGAGTAQIMTLKDAFKMYYRFTVIPAVAAIVISFAVVFTFGQTIVSAAGVPETFAGFWAAAIIAIYTAAIIWIFEPLSILVEGGVYHMVGKLFGKFTGTYANTVTAGVYATFGVIGLLWLYAIPVVGTVALIVAGIWSIWVLISGLSNQHRISKVDAFVVWIVGTAIFGILVLAVVFATASVSSVAINTAITANAS